MMYFLSEPKFETNFGEQPVRQRAAGWLADGQDEQAASSTFHPTFDKICGEKFCMSTLVSGSDQHSIVFLLSLVYGRIYKKGKL